MKKQLQSCQKCLKIKNAALWNYCLSRAEASTCSLFYPIQPLTSMVLGVLLLNEHMTVGFIAGAVLIVFGVLYSTLGKEKNR